MKHTFTTPHPDTPLLPPWPISGEQELLAVVSVQQN